MKINVVDDKGDPFNVVGCDDDDGDVEGIALLNAKKVAKCRCQGHVDVEVEGANVKMTVLRSESSMSKASVSEK